MDAGLWFVFGLVVGSVLTAAVYARRRPEPVATPAGEVTEATTERVRDLLAQGKMILAVKVVREETGWGLRDAKAAVDRIARGD